MGLNCQVNIINSSGVDNGAVKLPYLPYCVSTMKVLLSNHENQKMNIEIYPIKHFNTDDYRGGCVDQGKGVKVMWGGGVEEGVKTKLGPGESKLVYFSLFHEDSVASNYDLTLILDKGTEDQNDTEKIAVKLVPIHDSSNILRSINNNDSSSIEFEGSTILNYYPRWFPESFIKIHPTLVQDRENIESPKIEILKGNTDDQVIIRTNDKVIATIAGDMDGSEYNFELYRLDERIYVIRLWFFWLSMNKFKNKENLQPLKAFDKSKSIGWFKPELPDFERFDLVVGPENRVLLAGTDFHWQEYWYAIGSEIPQIEASIKQWNFPLGETIERLIARLGTVVNNTIWKDYQPIFDNLLNRSKQTNPYGPNDLFQGAIFENISDQHTKSTTKGQNPFRSHVPYVGAGKIVCDMISQDMTRTH